MIPTAENEQRACKRKRKSTEQKEDKRKQKKRGKKTNLARNVFFSIKVMQK
jgi:hypothetical protein